MRQASVLDVRQMAKSNPKVDVRLLNKTIIMNRELEGLGVATRKPEYGISHPLDSFTIEQQQVKVSVCTCRLGEDD